MRCLFLKYYYLEIPSKIQNNSFPERGTVYDFCFEKKASGVWVEWIEKIDKAEHTFPANAKVINFVIFFKNCTNLTGSIHFNSHDLVIIIC